jgi:hypothetical protein
VRESYYHTTLINSKIEHRLNLQCVRESYYHTTLINSIASWPLFNVFLVTGPSDQLHNSQIMYIIQGNILEGLITLTSYIMPFYWPNIYQLAIMSWHITFYTSSHNYITSYTWDKYSRESHNPHNIYHAILLIHQINLSSIHGI